MRCVGHQANLRMLEAVCRQCDVADERHHTNVEWFGNTAGAAAPSVISMRWDDWTAADDIALGVYLVATEGGVAAVARWMGTHAAALDVAQDDRVPYVRLRGVRLPIAVSLSHHGRFAAFACALRNRH